MLDLAICKYLFEVWLVAVLWQIYLSFCLCTTCLYVNSNNKSKAMSLFVYYNDKSKALRP